MLHSESGNTADGVALYAPSSQIVSALFCVVSSPTTSSSSSTTMDPSSTTLVQKGSYVSVLADVGHAMAFEAEAGEELDEISVGSLVVQVCLWSSCKPSTRKKRRHHTHTTTGSDVGLDQCLQQKSTVT